MPLIAEAAVNTYSVLGAPTLAALSASPNHVLKAKHSSWVSARSSPLHCPSLVLAFCSMMTYGMSAHGGGEAGGGGSDGGGGM